MQAQIPIEIGAIFRTFYTFALGKSYTTSSC